jgi:hypothetical protein
MKPPMPETTIVTFLGWQKIPGKLSMPLFNVNLPGHPLDRSTVSLKTLLANDLPIPNYPTEGK